MSDDNWPSLPPSLHSSVDGVDFDEVPETLRQSQDSWPTNEQRIQYAIEAAAESLQRAVDAQSRVVNDNISALHRQLAEKDRELKRQAEQKADLAQQLERVIAALQTVRGAVDAGERAAPHTPPHGQTPRLQQNSNGKRERDASSTPAARTKVQTRSQRAQRIHASH